MKAKCKVQKCVENVIKIVDGGNRCPTISQILRPLNGHVPQHRVTKSVLLHRIRRRLEMEFEMSVCAVNEAMYKPLVDEDGHVIRKSFLDKPPETEEQARKCIPNRFSPVAGFYFPKKRDAHDLILMEYGKKGARHGTLVQGVNAQRIALGVRNRFLNQKIATKSLKGSVNTAYAERFTPMLETILEMNSKVATMIHDLASEQLKLEQK